MHSRRFPCAGSPRDSTGPFTLPIKSEWLLILVILLFPALFIAPVSGIVIVEYFHQPGCTYCERTDPIVDAIGTEYGDRIALEMIEIDDRDGFRLLMTYGVTEIPVVVINRNRVMLYRDITPARLREEILLAESGAYPVPESRKSVFSADAFLAVLLSFVLGIMTGFSPCLLGSLVLLIASAGSTAATGGYGKYYPLTFGAGIITAYLVLAGIILGAGGVFLPDSGSRMVIYGTGGLVAILAGLIQTGLVSIPDWITRHTSALVLRFHTLPGIFLLGLVFAVLFAPCAIAPFLILTGIILITMTPAPVLMVLMFSLGILVPFVAFAAIRNSAQEWLLRYAWIVQKAGGLLLTGFGIWLLLSI